MQVFCDTGPGLSDKSPQFAHNGKICMGHQDFNRVFVCV